MAVEGTSKYPTYSRSPVPLDVKSGVVPPLLPLLELPPQATRNVIANTKGAAMSVRKGPPLPRVVLRGFQEDETVGV